MLDNAIVYITKLWLITSVVSGYGYTTPPKGDKSLIASYHAISVLSYFSNLLLQLMYDRLKSIS